LTTSRGIFFGTVAVFVALLIVTSSLALYYYGQNQETTSQGQKYASELSTALASYRSLSGSFNASLSEYGQTLALLSSAVANLNTSTPAYRNASVALASLWSSYQRLSSSGGRRSLVYSVNLLLDFGNGTRRWYNDTSVQPGWNGYVATLVFLKGNVQAVWYPQYGEHFVTSVDGVSGTSVESWFFWDYSVGKWTLAPTGADGLLVYNGTSIAWTLCGYDINFNPTCTP
jgi:hypothetical protein